MNADGSNARRLTRSNGNDFESAWSADGSKIAFQSNRDGNEEIYIMNADGSGQTRLTDNPAEDLDHDLVRDLRHRSLLAYNHFLYGYRMYSD